MHIGKETVYIYIYICRNCGSIFDNLFDTGRCTMIKLEPVKQTFAQGLFQLPQRQVMTDNIMGNTSQKNIPSLSVDSK